VNDLLWAITIIVGAALVFLIVARVLDLAGAS
jgi:hypothetical protein